MNTPRIDRAIDALRDLFERASGVRSAILYGSCARGTAREDSDIDVLVLATGRRGSLRKAIHDVESAHDVTVSPLILPADGLDRLDRQFLDAVLREGVPLAGELPAPTLRDLGLRPVRLVSYDLSDLDPPEKMRLHRRLDGYSTVRRRGRKRYERTVVGFLKEVGGRRLGRGAVLVPESALTRLEEILSRAGAKRWTIAAWAQS